MSVDAAGIVRGESLERLTLSIRNSFAAIEKRWPGMLDYGDVPLRGALERRVYQDALLDTTRLQTLADVTGDRANFAEWLPQQRSRWHADGIWGYLKAWARLIVYGLLRASGQGDERDRASATEFVFYALRPRFVNFFRPVIEQLGSHRCAVVCEAGYGVETEAGRHGLAVCKRQYARLQVHSVSVRRLKGKLKKIFRKGRGRNIGKFILEDLNPLLRGWINYFSLAEVKNIFEELDGWIRRKLRCIIWRQWKRNFTRAKNLRKRGLSENCAFQSAFNGRGAWWNSGASHMNNAYRKSYFDRCGLVSLLDQILQFQRTS